MERASPYSCIRSGRYRLDSGNNLSYLEQVYSIAWLFNLVMPLLFTTMVMLIVCPPSRAVLFPPAPIALVSSKTGGIQSPKAGVLGSHDSITGAPEKHQGEAVEQEASNFVAGFATIAMSSATGKHEAADPETDPVNSSVPDPTNVAMVSADAKSSAAGGMPNAKHDKTKQPMEDAMWTQMRPIMHIVGDIADGWERFAKYAQVVSSLFIPSDQVPVHSLRRLHFPSGQPDSN